MAEGTATVEGRYSSEEEHEVEAGSEERTSGDPEFVFEGDVLLTFQVVDQYFIKEAEEHSPHTGNQ